MAAPLTRLEEQGAKAVARRAEPNLIEKRGFSLLGKFNSVLNVVATTAFIAPMLGGALNWLSEKKILSGVSGHLHRAGILAKYPQKTMGEVLGHISSAASKSPKITEMAAKVPGTAVAMSRVSQYAKTTLPVGLKGKLMEANAGNVLVAGSMAVGQAAQTFSTFGGRMRTLKQMQRDLTGETPSTLGIMLGRSKLHPLVKAASGEATGLRATGATMLDVAGSAFNIMTMFNPRPSMVKAIAVSTGTTMASSIVTSGQTALKGYQDMTLSFAHVGKAAMDSYVDLIGGLAPKANAQMVQKVAEQAFAKQLKPPEVLRMVAETSFLQPPAAARLPVKIGGKTIAPKLDQGQGHVAALAARAANDTQRAARTA